jgi:hypothetical protein
MDKVYTLRVVVQLFEQDKGDFPYEVLQLRSQELTGDLQELCMMGAAVPAMADGMAMAVLGAERRRHAEQELTGKGLPY